MPDQSANPLAGRGPGAELKSKLTVAHSYVDSLIDQEIAGLGVSIGKADVLTVVLIAGDDSPAPGQLAEWLSLTTAGVTGRLDSLERSALIERRRDPNDGRRLTVHLTPAGAALAETVLAAKDTALTELIENSLGRKIANRLVVDLQALTNAIEDRLG